MRQMTVFVNLFQNLGSAWLHEASSRVSDRIYICNRKKKREDKIRLLLYLLGTQSHILISSTISRSPAVLYLLGTQTHILISSTISRSPALLYFLGTQSHILISSTISRSPVLLYLLGTQSHILISSII